MRVESADEFHPVGHVESAEEPTAIAAIATGGCSSAARRG